MEKTIKKTYFLEDNAFFHEEEYKSVPSTKPPLLQRKLSGHNIDQVVSQVVQHQSFGDDMDEDQDEIDSNNFLTDSEGVSSSGYEDPGIHTPI